MNEEQIGKKVKQLKKRNGEYFWELANSPNFHYSASFSTEYSPMESVETLVGERRHPDRGERSNMQTPKGDKKDDNFDF